MTTATKRTPGPWKRNRVDSIVGANGVEVCNMSLYGYHLPPFANANAEHILAACNTHDALTARVAELEAALEMFDRWPLMSRQDGLRAAFDAARAALAKS